MIKKMSIHAGKYERKGKKETFRSFPGGENFQVYIEFDNGQFLDIAYL